MADIRAFTQNQTVLRAEADRLKCKLWPILEERGSQWTERLDQMMRAFAGHDQDPWRTVGMLAELGFLTLLESYQPFTSQG